ncbi:hypothetical protein ACJRO7_028071 [Eucalyptus globulus]|uniref:Uncharacterized protein n=1 Tax=Eucalyptus globulus TaxID=34317 RepID=A0ABD3K3D6_EUCGL
MDGSEDALREALADKQASSVPKPEIGATIAALIDLGIDKARIERRLQDAVSGAGDVALTREAERQRVVNTPESRRFYIPSFSFKEHKLNSNVFTFWHEHFRLEEDMFRRGCYSTEYHLKAWDFVERFADLLVKDVKTGACYRAHHVLEDFCNEELQKDLGISAEKAAELKHVLATLRRLSVPEVHAKIKKYGVTAPYTKNPLSDPIRPLVFFSLSKNKRPKTALGILHSVKCFKALLWSNKFKLPFAVGQIGEGVNYEIPHRPGFWRFHQCTLAEIEHFVDPKDKSHPKFSRVADLEMFILSREQQMSGQAAIKTRNKDRLQFRQHLANEMGSLWSRLLDAEIDCSYGWILCVVISDRSTYECRTCTGLKSGVAFVAHKKVAEPREVEKLVIVPDKKELGLAFRGNQFELLEAMGEEEALQLKAALKSKGEAEFIIRTMEKSVIIKDKMVNISKQKIKEHQRVFTPSVIGSSFGMGHIIYCLF